MLVSFCCSFCEVTLYEITICFYFFILETKARFDRQLQQRYETEKQSSDLENEFERLKSCFIESGPPSDATDLYLTKAQGVVRAAAQRMR